MASKKWLALAAVGALMTPWMAAMGQEPAAPNPVASAIPDDQRATDAQVDKLFEVMRIRQQMAATATMMPQLMKQQMDEQVKEMEKDHPEWATVTDEQRQAAGKIMEKYMSQAMTLYSADDMMTDMRGLYQKYLSRQDVEATIAFYSSPAGQHFLDMVPAVMQEYLPNVMTKIQAKMRPLIVDMAKEMAAVMQAPSGKK